MFAYQNRLDFEVGRSDLPVQVENHSVYQAFDAPREVGCYSVDSTKRIHFDRSQMKYYISASYSKMPFDLNHGYAYAIKKEFSRAVRMEQFLRWILHNGSPFLDKRFGGIQDVDLVTIRGTLKTILNTPFHGPGWTIIATKFKGVIYFYEEDSEATRLHMPTLRTEREKKMSSWGYKFEQYMTAATPNGVPDISSSTHEVEEFSIVLQNRLKNHKLLFKAEVDATNKDEVYKLSNGDPSCYVELKTSKMSPTFRYDSLFQRFKSLQWWSQSYVAGIKKIVCGMRDDLGYVKSVEEFRTDDLPLMSSSYWNTNGCLNFCDRFLTFLKENVVEDNHRVVYKLVHVPGFSVSCQKLSYACNTRVVPDWFATEFNKR